MGGEKGAANAAAFFVVACCISTQKYKDTPPTRSTGKKAIAIVENTALVGSYEVR